MRKQQKITVKSYVHYRGELVEFDDLPPDVKQKAATELALRYFNTLFAGKAVFRVGRSQRAEAWSGILQNRGKGRG